MARRKKKPPTHGGARKGAGRPDGTGEHDGLLRVRVSLRLLERVRAVADGEGLTQATWVRGAIEDKLKGRDE